MIQLFTCTCVIYMYYISTGYPRYVKESRVFHCFTCEEKYQLPENGVDGLPINQDVESVEYRMGEQYCKKHQKENSYHCRYCNETVCPTCYNEEHKDKGHPVSRHKSEVVRKKAAIQAAVRDLTPKVDRINQYRKRLEITNDHIAKEAAGEHREIDENVKLLVDNIHDKADKLKKDVSDTAESEREKNLQKY